MLKRQSIRLKNFDYSKSGRYFVTICTQDRECLFGYIVNDVMKLNEMGKIIENIWESLPKHHTVELDVFQIMPNHVHMIIKIVGGAPVAGVGAIHESPDKHDAPLQRSLLSKIIGYFKMNSAKTIHIINPNIRVWQRNYYEHIVRTKTDLNKIREYIKINPQMWEKDQNNLKELLWLEQSGRRHH